MSDRTHRPARTGLADIATAAAGAAVAGAATGIENESNQSAQEVLLYLTLNNTTHKSDELPETLAALKQAEADGLGHRELLPISDPYSTKRKGGLVYHDDTNDYAFGEEGAERIDWWHGDEELEEGQVRVNGEILTLGTDNIDPSNPEETTKVLDAWRKTLGAGGMDDEGINKSLEALFKDKKGNFRKLGSGDGATNELVQYMMAMHRSEKGEIDVKSIVFSGHHWRGDGENGEYPTTPGREGGHGIWGEIPGLDHVYDDQSDFFSLVDVAELKEAFPKAYDKVESVQLAACNTDSLGIEGADGNEMTTNEYLQDTYSNIEFASYTKEELAPLAKSGFGANGEFVLDSMRQENGDQKAAEDVRNMYPGLVRSTLDEDGNLQEFVPEKNRKPYKGNKRKGLKGKSKKDFDERKDLKDHIYNTPTLPETEVPSAIL